MTVSAVVVTRGDVPLADIRAALTGYPFAEVVVHDNMRRSNDAAVHGRYLAIRRTTGDLVYVQDDDCVLEPDAIAALVDAHEPGHVVCNMPAEFRATGFYDDHALVGFGAVFDRDLPAAAFETFGMSDAIAETDDDWPEGFFNRTCDIVFTALTPRILVDVPYRNLEHAYAATRMYRQPSHVGERTRMLELVLKVRDGVTV